MKIWTTRMSGRERKMADAIGKSIGTKRQPAIRYAIDRAAEIMANDRSKISGIGRDEGPMVQVTLRISDDNRKNLELMSSYLGDAGKAAALRAAVRLVHGGLKSGNR